MLLIVTQVWKYLQIGNFPPYVNCILLAECSGSFATYETETNIKYLVDCRFYSCRHTLVQFQSVVKFLSSYVLMIVCSYDFIQKMVLLIYTGLTKEVINSIDTKYFR